MHGPNGILLLCVLALQACRSGPQPPPDAPPSGPQDTAPAPPLAAADVPAFRERKLADLETRIVAEGVGRPARDNAVRLLRAMFQETDPEVLARLSAARLHIVLIPMRRRLTDIPELGRLRQEKMPDGSPLEGMRGLAGIGTYRDGVAVAVGEENLIGPPGGYVDLFLLSTRGVRDEDRLVGQPGKRIQGAILVHELGHAVLEYGLRFTRQTRTQASYLAAHSAYADSMARPGKTGLGAYADSSLEEFFATATEAHFGLGRDLEPGLARVNPAMGELLTPIYGPPRSLRR